MSDRDIKIGPAEGYEAGGSLVDVKPYGAHEPEPGFGDDMSETTIERILDLSRLLIDDAHRQGYSVVQRDEMREAGNLLAELATLRTQLAERETLIEEAKRLLSDALPLLNDAGYRAPALSLWLSRASEVLK